MVAERSLKQMRCEARANERCAASYADPKAFEMISHAMGLRIKGMMRETDPRRKLLDLRRAVDDAEMAARLHDRLNGSTGPHWVNPVLVPEEGGFTVQMNRSHDKNEYFSNLVKLCGMVVETARREGLDELAGIYESRRVESIAERAESLPPLYNVSYFGAARQFALQYGNEERAQALELEALKSCETYAENIRGESIFKTALAYRFGFEHAHEYGQYRIAHEYEERVGDALRVVARDIGSVADQEERYAVAKFSLKLCDEHGFGDIVRTLAEHVLLIEEKEVVDTYAESAKTDVYARVALGALFKGFVRRAEELGNDALVERYEERLREIRNFTVPRSEFS